MDRLVEDLRVGSPNWAWHVYEYWKLLSHEQQELFFYEELENCSDEGILSVVQRAEVFWSLWTVERVWETNANLARAWMVQFHSIQSDVRTSEESDYVAYVLVACPYLSELIDSDANWKGFRLPAERTHLDT